MKRHNVKSIMLNRKIFVKCMVYFTMHYNTLTYLSISSNLGNLIVDGKRES
jgi:hypothetical protein